MNVKRFLAFSVCIAFITVPVHSHGEKYLVRRYYEITPGKKIASLQIGHNTYSILSDNWKEGDTYSVPAPEKEGYLFLPAFSDSLSGKFGKEDVYLDLYYTRRLFSQDKQKSLTQ